MSTIVQHTKGKVISLQFKTEAGLPKALTGVTSIKGVMRSGTPPNESDTTIIGAIVVSDAANGLAAWTLNAADTDSDGHFGLTVYAYSPGDVLEAFTRDELFIAPAPTPPTP